MRSTRGDVRDQIDLHKRNHDGLKVPRSGGETEQSTFARFLEPFDFRLFQQYRSKADLTLAANDVSSGVKRTPPFHNLRLAHVMSVEAERTPSAPLQST